MLNLKIAEGSAGTGIKLDQARLDIAARSRTSRLPWRGQFSPEFIEYIMAELCPAAEVFYDPFCGSGTVLFEAIQRSKSAFGVEINPAAWHLAALSSFTTLSSKDQSEVLSKIAKITYSTFSHGTLFSKDSIRIIESIHDMNLHPFLRLALAAVVLLGMGNGAQLNERALERGSFAILQVLKDLRSNPGQAQCFLADARQSPLASGSVGAVITSPPYINVFNYHQNYRPAAEFIGWRPLQAASSEIGANRKHRQNRFLTVIQYCLDMARSISETSRIMQYGAPLVIILGRTSNVLGASFKNGDIISEVIESTNAFYPLAKAERRFRNRYGEQIYEDVIFTRRRNSTAQIQDGILRQIGKTALQGAEVSVPEKNRGALSDATKQAGMVQPSPLLSLSIPSYFADSSKQRV